jgi:hypothetical protein
MVAVSKSKGRPKTLDDGELASAGEVMADGPLASGPKSRRRTQSRLHALRAMERLGLVGDGELKRALVERPALRWLVDEKGARWGISRRAWTHQRPREVRRRGEVGARVPTLDEGGRGGDPAVQNRQEQAAGHRRTGRRDHPRGKRVWSQASRDQARPSAGGAMLGDRGRRVRRPRQ